MKSHQLTIDETIVLKSAIISTLLQQAPEPLITKFVWRNSVLLSQYFTLHPNPDVIELLSPQTLDLLNRLDFFKPLPDTSYLTDCRPHRVPIPPVWAESGTDWVLQGVLTQNLLKGQTSLNPQAIPSFGEAGSAAVYTYSDPTVRGACIALPRDTGVPGPMGSVAGIICQSAETGHACFWDNILRTDPTLQRIGWRGGRLGVLQLRNGSDLAENCTKCHRGNNVFLISPDDPTWAKVLRGPLADPLTSSFTTQVEASSDNRGGHPRYIPIPNLAERPDAPDGPWENTLAANCGGACHEIPPIGKFGIPQPMGIQQMGIENGPRCRRADGDDPTPGNPMGGDPSTCYTEICTKVLAGSCGD